MQAITDDKLVELLKISSNKEEVFTLIVCTYSQRLYAHIRRMVIIHEEADDILQDVFLKAWTKLDSFEGRSQLYTWLYRIATNACLEYLDKKKRRGAYQSHFDPSEMANMLKADSYFCGNKAELKLQQAIQTLPAKQRLIFNMKYFDHMKYDQISDILGTSTGALKAGYHHAVKKIELFLKTD